MYVFERRLTLNSRDKMKLLLNRMFLSAILLVLPTAIYSQSFGLDLTFLEKEYTMNKSCEGQQNDSNEVMCKLAFYDEEGLIAYEGQSIDDLPEGTWKVYKLGRLYSEIEHKQGQIDGSYKIYSSEGNLFQELTFKGGVPHGSLVTYSLFPPYQTIEFLEVKDGLLHGKGIFYFEGKVLVELRLQEGKLHGDLKIFGDNKNLVGLVSYEEGKLISNLIYYNDQGIKRVENILDSAHQVFILQKKYGRKGKLKKVKKINSSFGYEAPIYMYMNTGSPFFDMVVKEMDLE